MRNLIFIAAAAIAAVAFYSCKTNEANMTDAYLKAMAGRENDDLGLDSTIYSKIRHEMKHGEMVVGSDTVEISTQWVRVTEDGGGIRESLKQYNVVVGQFKQLFNAKSMRERLVETGYPGAFLVQTAEPYYFVIAASYAEARDAVDKLHEVQKDPNLKMKAPLPFILEPATHRYR